MRTSPDHPDTHPDPRHAGPPCLHCAKPRATEAAWEEVPQGKGEELCWATRASGCMNPAFDWPGEAGRLRGECVRLREERDALEARLARVRAALEGTPANVETIARLLCAKYDGDAVAIGWWAFVSAKWKVRVEPVLAALRERCLGDESATPTPPPGDESREVDRG